MPRLSSLLPALLPALLLVAGLTFLTACNATPLRGVGAAPRAGLATQPATTNPNAPQPLSPRQQAGLQRGTALAVAADDREAPGAIALSEAPAQPEMGATRADAVAAMRAKAANAGKEKPNVFDIQRSPVRQMTKAEQAARIAELEAAALQNASDTPDAACNDALAASPGRKCPVN